MSAKIEDIIEEVEHSFAMEHMVMTEEEKENLRKVGRGEMSHRELVDRYVTEAKRKAASLN